MPSRNLGAPLVLPFTTASNSGQDRRGGKARSGEPTLLGQFSGFPPPAADSSRCDWLLFFKDHCSCRFVALSFTLFFGDISRADIAAVAATTASSAAWPAAPLLLTDVISTLMSAEKELCKHGMDFGEGEAVCQDGLRLGCAGADTTLMSMRSVAGSMTT